MREAAGSLKSDLQAKKKLKILDVFVLKLPDVDSHRFHLTEGEVHKTAACYQVMILQKNM